MDCSGRAAEPRVVVGRVAQGVNRTLRTTSHSLQTRRAGLVKVTRVSPSPVTARLGCSTEAAPRPSWVSRIGKRIGQSCRVAWAGTRAEGWS